MYDAILYLYFSKIRSRNRLNSYHVQFQLKKETKSRLAENNHARANWNDSRANCVACGFNSWVL